MSMKSIARRAVVGFGLFGVVATAIVTGAADASASTIPAGHIQICAQGDYPVFIHVLSEPVPNSNEFTRSLVSRVVSPNEGSASCWKNSTEFTTLGRSVQVDVVGLHSDGSQFYIGSEWWNSQTGLGIGAEDTVSSPRLETW
jgi:hypothetical protein